MIRAKQVFSKEVSTVKTTSCQPVIEDDSWRHNSELYCLKLTDMSIRNGEPVTVEKYIKVFLPPCSPPATGDSDIEERGFGRITHHAVRLGDVEYKIKETGYNGESQDTFEKLAKKALTDDSAKDKLLYMLSENKQYKRKIKQHYCLVLRIVRDVEGGWDWADKYSNADISVEKFTHTMYVPESNSTERCNTGPVYENGKFTTGMFRKVETTAEVSMKKKSERVLWTDKIEVLTSSELIEGVRDKKQTFLVRDDGKDRSSVVRLDKTFSCPGYYEEGEEFDRGWRMMFSNEMENNPTYRNEVIRIASLMMVCPSFKKVFIVCDHNTVKEGKSINQGCGHNHKDCHLKFVKEQLINICSSSKNKYHEKAVELSKQLEQNNE